MWFGIEFALRSWPLSQRLHGGGAFPPNPPRFEVVEDEPSHQQPCQDVMEKGESALDLDGRSVQQLGGRFYSSL